MVRDIGLGLGIGLALGLRMGFVLNFLFSAQRYTELFPPRNIAVMRKQTRILKIHMSQTFSLTSCCWRNRASISPIIQRHLCRLVSVRSEPSRLVRQSMWELHWLKPAAMSATDSVCQCWIDIAVDSDSSGSSVVVGESVRMLVW